MQLRDHPLMNYRGVKNWPPAWILIRGNSRKAVQGEVGVLAHVHSNLEISRKCYLVMKYEGATCVGTLIFEDHAFCKQVRDLVSLHLKRSIKDIGNLDLPHPL